MHILVKNAHLQKLKIVLLNSLKIVYFNCMNIAQLSIKASYLKIILYSKKKKKNTWLGIKLLKIPCPDFRKNKFIKNKKLN